VWPPGSGMSPIASNPDLWPFNLETGIRVASEVRNRPSKFGHSRPLRSRIIRYLRDGRTDTADRRMDKSNAYCPFPMVGDIIMTMTITIMIMIKIIIAMFRPIDMAKVTFDRNTIFGYPNNPELHLRMTSCRNAVSWHFGSVWPLPRPQSTIWKHALNWCWAFIWLTWRKVTRLIIIIIIITIIITIIYLLKTQLKTRKIDSIDDYRTTRMHTNSCPTKYWHSGNSLCSVFRSRARSELDKIGLNSTSF